MHKVGDKVACVNDVFDTTQVNFTLMFEQLPIKDQVYVIRTSESGAVRLEEILNPVVPINLGDIESPIWITDEVAFASDRFAPLLTNRNELTEELLNDISIGVEEEELMLI
jgi:hypothetical protein